MIKTVLLVLLGLYFFLSGVNHLFNQQVLEEYADMHNLFSPKAMVFLSGLLLMFGGLSLMTGFLRFYGIIGLSVFLATAAFLIHQFWKQKDKIGRMVEGMQFSKNMAILTELIYIATG